MVRGKSWVIAVRILLALVLFISIANAASLSGELKNRGGSYEGYIWTQGTLPCNQNMYPGCGSSAVYAGLTIGATRYNCGPPSAYHPYLYDSIFSFEIPEIVKKHGVKSATLNISYLFGSCWVGEPPVYFCNYNPTTSVDICALGTNPDAVSADDRSIACLGSTYNIVTESTKYQNGPRVYDVTSQLNNLRATGIIGFKAISSMNWVCGGFTAGIYSSASQHYPRINYVLDNKAPVAAISATVDYNTVNLSWSCKEQEGDALQPAKLYYSNASVNVSIMDIVPQQGSMMWSAAALDDGNYTLSAYCGDEYGAWSRGDTNLTLFRAAYATNVRVQETSPTTTDDLHCVFDSMINNATDNYQLIYSWYVNGNKTDANTSALGASRTKKHDGVSCSIAVLDNGKLGKPVSSKPVEIKNSVPAVPSNIVVERAATFPFTISWQLAYDADGDDIIYRVELDHSPVKETNHTSLDFDGELDFGVHSVTITASDGEANSSAASADFTFGFDFYLLSPENKTYNASVVPLGYSSSIALDSLHYTLDSNPPAQLNSNTSLSFSENGTHKITVSAAFDNYTITRAAEFEVRFEAKPNCAEEPAKVFKEIMPPIIIELKPYAIADVDYSEVPLDEPSYPTSYSASRSLAIRDGLVLKRELYYSNSSTTLMLNFSTSKPIDGVKIIDSVPKEFAQSARGIEILTNPLANVTIIEEDPQLLFDVERIESSFIINYTVNGEKPHNKIAALLNKTIPQVYAKRSEGKITERTVTLSVASESRGMPTYSTRLEPVSVNASAKPVISSLVPQPTEPALEFPVPIIAAALALVLAFSAITERYRRRGRMERYIQRRKLIKSSMM